MCGARWPRACTREASRRAPTGYDRPLPVRPRAVVSPAKQLRETPAPIVPHSWRRLPAPGTRMTGNPRAESRRRQPKSQPDEPILVEFTTCVSLAPPRRLAGRRPVRLRAPQDALARASAGPRRPPTRRRGPTPPRRTPARRHPVAHDPLPTTLAQLLPGGTAHWTAHVDTRRPAGRSVQVHAGERCPATTSARSDALHFVLQHPVAVARDAIDATVRRAADQADDITSPGYSKPRSFAGCQGSSFAIRGRRRRGQRRLDPQLHLLRYTLRCATVPFVWLRGCAATGEGGSELTPGRD